MAARDFEKEYLSIPPAPPRCDRVGIANGERCPEKAEYVLMTPNRNILSCRKCLGDATAAASAYRPTMVERLV